MKSIKAIFFKFNDREQILLLLSLWVIILVLLNWQVLFTLLQQMVPIIMNYGKPMVLLAEP